MMKRWLLLIVAIIAPFIIVLAACEHQAEVRLEAFLALERMHRSSIQCNDVDIMHIDELLIDVEDREAKLEQIVVQMQRWMEEKEAGDYTDLPCGWHGHLDIIATPGELAQIQQNNRYRVTLLELSVYHFDEGLQSMEFKPTFEVMDLTENQTYIVDVAQEYLQEREDALNTRKQARIAIKNVLLSNLQTIHEYAKHWKAKEYDKDVYYVSGEGLGLSDGKLTSGMWNFRSDTGQIAPVDNEGLALFDFIMSP